MSLRCVGEGIFYAHNMLDFKVIYNCNRCNENSFFATSFHTYTFWLLAFIDDLVFDLQFYGSYMYRQYSQSCSIGHFIFTCRMRLKFLSARFMFGLYAVVWFFSCTVSRGGCMASLNSQVQSIKSFLTYRLGTHKTKSAETYHGNTNK